MRYDGHQVVSSGGMTGSVTLDRLYNIIHRLQDKKDVGKHLQRKTNELSDFQEFYCVCMYYYHCTREIEVLMRCLKGDPDLSPIFGKTDDVSKAHIHLIPPFGIKNDQKSGSLFVPNGKFSISYSAKDLLKNANIPFGANIGINGLPGCKIHTLYVIRHTLKVKGVTADRHKLERVMNTWKGVTASMDNDKSQCITVRYCPKPEPKIALLYDALKMQRLPVY
jgi:hypothetical protein